MVFIEHRSILSGMLVQEAMRKRVIRVSRETTLSDCTNRMVKNKVAAVLVAAEDDRPVGVVSKTDLIGAFYVLSLSDSARFRSGSCRACTSGRLIVGV
ncbi:MAG: CBS domain-containing protein [Desulfobacterales bacterium]|jgi:CBS-domain-containing membrane protein